VHPTTKWNDVDVDVDSDTVSRCVAVVKALLDGARSRAQLTAESVLSVKYVPRRVTTVGT